MNSFLVLFIGELQRMKKYNILAASFLASLIWIGFLHFTNVEDVSGIFPMLIYIDATSMSMLMIGVTMFYEKQEGVIKTMLVAPISKGEYILAKTFANIVSNLITVLAIYAYAKLFKEVNVNILGLLSAALLVAFFHSLIGFILTYYSKDFTELLMGMMKYAFIFMIPVLLENIGMIKNEIVGKLLYIIPTKASMSLLKASTSGVDSWEIYLSVGYLLVASFLLYFVVIKKFDEFAIKESGV